MAVLGAAAGADDRRGQVHAVAVAQALGIDHPARQAADARLVGEAVQRLPGQLEFTRREYFGRI